LVAAQGSRDPVLVNSFADAAVGGIAVASSASAARAVMATSDLLIIHNSPRLG
jgi:hypothetical protein